MEWVYWLSGTLGSFGVLEYIALSRRESGKPSGTLSAWLRRLLGLDPKHWRRFILAPMFTGGVLVFLSHIIANWP